MTKPFIKKFKHFAAAAAFLSESDLRETIGYHENELIASVTILPTGKQPDGYFNEVRLTICFIVD